MYSDLENLELILPRQRLLELCDDVGLGEFIKNPPNAPYLIVKGAVEEADAMIEMYLNDHYEIPLDPVPKIITVMSAHLAICTLYERPHDLDAPEGIVKRRDRFIKILLQMKNGEVLLPSKTRRLDFTCSKTVDDIVFSDDLLAQF